jgi:hypothetical protein
MDYDAENSITGAVGLFLMSILALAIAFIASAGRIFA